MFGDDNDTSHNPSGLGNDSKDGDYRDHGNDDADDDSSGDLGGKGTGGQLRSHCRCHLCRRRRRYSVLPPYRIEKRKQESWFLQVCFGRRRDRAPAFRVHI